MAACDTMVAPLAVLRSDAPACITAVHVTCSRPRLYIVGDVHGRLSVWHHARGGLPSLPAIEPIDAISLAGASDGANTTARGGILSIASQGRTLLVEGRGGALHRVILDEGGRVQATERLSALQGGPFNFAPLAAVFGEHSAVAALANVDDCDGLIRVCALWSGAILANLYEGRPLSGAPARSGSRGKVMCMRMIGGATEDEATLLAVGYDDGSVQVVSLALSKEEVLFDEKVFPMTVMCIDALLRPSDGALLLAVGGPSPEVVLVAVPIARAGGEPCMQQRTVMRRPLPGEGGLASIVLSSDGALLFTGGWDGRLRAFASATLESLASAAIHADSITAMKRSTATSGGARRIPSDAHRSAPRLFGGRPLLRLQDDGDDECGGQCLLVGSKDGIASLWSIAAILALVPEKGVSSSLAEGASGSLVSGADRSPAGGAS